jgi:ABC-type lipoprotein export system ATPase subunit
VLVQVRGLTHGFGSQHPLFENISFELQPNHVYALTGPSGSGKSTVLGLLAGWMRPLSGTITRTDIVTTAWVFQNPHGVAKRTALDHVAFPLIAAGARHKPAREAAHQRLEQVGLARVASSEFRHLSGGEAQRLMLARGLALRPSLLLVDEPTAQLDQHTAEAVNAAIASISEKGTIVVVATHDARTRDACTDVIDLATRITAL